MRMVPCDKNEFKVRKNSDNFKLLMDFKESDFDCVRLDDYSWANAKSAQCSLLASMKHYRITGIAVIMRKENIYLLKTPIF